MAIASFLFQGLPNIGQDCATMNPMDNMYGVCQRVRNSSMPQSECIYSQFPKLTCFQRCPTCAETPNPKTMTT